MLLALIVFTCLSAIVIRVHGMNRMRLPRSQKHALARQLVEVALTRVRSAGRFIDVRGVSGRPVELVEGALTFLHTTPFTGAHGGAGEYVLDIWQQGAGKVFSAGWEPLVIVAFRYGPWMNDLVPGSFVG